MINCIVRTRMHEIMLIAREKENCFSIVVNKLKACNISCAIKYSASDYYRYTSSSEDIIDVEYSLTTRDFVALNQIVNKMD